MTWPMTRKAVLAALPFALAAAAAVPAAAQDDIFVITEPVDLDPANPEMQEVGELIYRGGVVIEPGEEEIGGISGLDWYEDRLYAVSDDGKWLTIQPDEIDGRLIDLLTVARGDLNDERGRRLRGKDDSDAEAITRDSDGSWLVAFERDHRIWRYATLDGPAQASGIVIDRLANAGGDANSGIEAFDRKVGDSLICGEFTRAGEANCRHDFQEMAEEIEVRAGIAGFDPVPTDATCDGLGTCYVLLRSYTAGVGNHIAIVRLASGAEAEVIATLDTSLSVDNFEGLALREQYGKTYLYIVSDNNFSSNQRTLLMKFEIRQDEPLVAEAPEPVVDYETTDVVLVTSMGEITVRLETERAPITAGNFLRYIDEDRFDGTVFYRAMKLDREPRPNGLIQGGTQFDPNRILPGIPHEPTTVTGLTHTNGALSMAMLEPGSANGDFSIMLQDQVGLDAQPDSDDPIWKNGYAVFGYVIDGMDVVSAIHAAPADPDKGEGVMRGQILADPVEIVDVRRVEPAE